MEKYQNSNPEEFGIISLAKSAQYISECGASLETNFPKVCPCAAATVSRQPDLVLEIKIGFLRNCEELRRFRKPKEALTINGKERGLGEKRVLIKEYATGGSTGSCGPSVCSPGFSLAICAEHRLFAEMAITIIRVGGSFVETLITCRVPQ